MSFSSEVKKELCSVNAVDTEQKKAELYGLLIFSKVKTEGEKNAIRQMRGQAPWYVKGLRGSAKIKNHLTQMNTLEELETILKDFEKELEGE